MNDNLMNDTPMNDQRKEASIAYILDQGLVKPQTAVRRIRDMLPVLGPRSLFWDMSSFVLFTTLTLALTLLALLYVPEAYTYAAAVGSAPLLFLLMTFFTETSERTGGLYELKQTCRYTVRQMTALRVMCYCVPGILFTTAVTAISAQNAQDFFTLLPVCLSMLFLCAVVQLSALRFVRRPWALAVISAGWALVNLAIPTVWGEQWEVFLRGVPVLFSVILAVVSAAALIAQIRKMLMEVDHYAVA